DARGSDARLSRRAIARLWVKRVTPQLAPGAAPNRLIGLMTGACVAPHDGVAPLGNSDGYYLHDDALS
ncbi:hypothetical protein, partial [Hydrogenophaga sp.]|uniref:hypothetical protein n=1 Tax=Hydrogenophaga sp. TaxID=1904254 RepID=UPI0025BF432E